MTTGGSFMQNQQPSTLKEIRVHGTQDFPCAFYQTGTRIKGNMVKHHWHEEVELLSRRRTIINGYGEPLAFHIQRKVLAHHGQAD